VASGYRTLAGNSKLAHLPDALGHRDRVGGWWTLTGGRWQVIVAWRSEMDDRCNNTHGPWIYREQAKVRYTYQVHAFGFSRTRTFMTFFGYEANLPNRMLQRPSSLRSFWILLEFYYTNNNLSLSLSLSLYIYILYMYYYCFT
jgi:hypothetical protein